MYRSFHFIPAHKKELFGKVKSLKADHYIFDLEDAVPNELKHQARANILDFLKNSHSNNLWIRVNDIYSNEWEKDYNLIREINNVGIVIPKYQDNKSINDKLETYNKILLIEDLRMLNQLNMIKLPSNTFALGLGLEDMLSNFPIASKEITPLIDGIKLQFVKYVKQNNVLAIDGVFTSYKDKSPFNDECRKAVSFGFDAKFSIHPNQIDEINDNFSISDDLIDWAKKIIKLAKANNVSGYQIINNILVSPPKIEKAKAILKSLGE